MKGDFTRFLFKKENHYHDVRMQQGRVQLDADWNEQIEIAAHRTETETVDEVGTCGGPLHSAGFKLVPKGVDLEIGKGHYYVNGILCENENVFLAGNQPDFPENGPFIIENNSLESAPKNPGIYLAFLEVWKRHITAIEDPQIREDALGGPDTTTRTKTIWQVKLVRLGDNSITTNCLDTLPAWDKLTAASDIKLAAQAEPGDKSTSPCILAPGAGYRRLENQLYRVEIHRADTNGRATFKWSRDNGSIVASWTAQDNDKLTLSTVGRDKMLNFAAGQWVELTDDDRELLGNPGVLVKIDDVNGNDIIIDSATAIPPGPVDIKNFSANPKARRWDSDGELTTKTVWTDLEDGIQVKFSNNKKTYRTGDYWMIPARTSTGDIEWPAVKSGGGNKTPIEQTPHGIQHSYCRLALLGFDGNKWEILADCRKIFPPVTELTSLFYISGDGQEGMPGQMLSKPLQVGVANGSWPVAKAKVKFKIIPDTSGGVLHAGDSVVIEKAPNSKEMVVLTTDQGIADCKWKLDSDVANVSQQVQATLLDADDNQVHLPIRFTASLSIASTVAYSVPDCKTQYNSPELTVHSLFSDAMPNSWPDIDNDGHSTVKDVLDALLCKLDASKIPFEVSDCANSIFETKRQTVAEALLALCHLERIAGCAVTIGNENQTGTYDSIQDALEKEKGDDICLCLLPGNHTIESDLEDKGRNSIKITGCGTSITVKGSRVLLAARNVTLYGAKFNVNDATSSILLAGENITAENCEFAMKLKNKNSAPLVTIVPLDAKQSAVNLRWKSNKMEAWWVKEVPQNISEVLMPVADVGYSTKARDRLVKLSKLNPYEKVEEFDATLEMIAKDIESLPAAGRMEWYERRSTRRINKLPKQQKTAMASLFNVINSGRMTEKLKLELRHNLATVAKAYYIFNYTDALALKIAVGGWLENNIIMGYVSLHYTDHPPTYLDWSTGDTPGEIDGINKNKRAWTRETWKGKEYIFVENVSLKLQGNTIYAVRSNAPNFMKIINDIIKTGKGELEALDIGFESITATDNTFLSNANSFISKSLIMQGNQFAGGTQPWSVVANVICYLAIFTGNLAFQPDMNAIIECLIRKDPLKSANFLRIEN